jgi:hypothetical protein
MTAGERERQIAASMFLWKETRRSPATFLTCWMALRLAATIPEDFQR